MPWLTPQCFAGQKETDLLLLPAQNRETHEPLSVPWERAFSSANSAKHRMLAHTCEHLSAIHVAKLCLASQRHQNMATLLRRGSQEATSRMGLWDMRLLTLRQRPHLPALSRDIQLEVLRALRYHRHEALEALGVPRCPAFKAFDGSVAAGLRRARARLD